MPEYPWIIYRMSEGPLTTKEVHQGVNEQLNRKLGTDWGYSEYEWANLLQGFRPLPIRTASGTIAHFTDGADAVPFKSLTAQILPIQSGTGTPSPSNPRPISGTSVLNVTRTGANLFPFETVSGTTYAEKSISLEASTYTLSLVASGNSSTQMRTIFQYTDNSYGGECLFNKDTREAKTVTLTKPVKALLFYAADNYPSSVGFTFEYSDIQLELGSTVTTYEPYTGSTYPVPLGQTVYGGSADVVGGRGTSDLKYLEIDGTEASLTLDSASNVVRLTLSDLPSSNVSSQDYRYWGSESIYKYAATANLGNNEVTMRTSGYLYYKNTSCTTLSDFQMFFATQKANGTPFAVCYELATPTDFTFTGQPINSYLGVNNVWTDSGEVLDVEYRSNF